ncbi:MAG: tripartite tricarboxylate transporter substrate-binding protein, partial [Bryobacteraceae bacterium]
AFADDEIRALAVLSPKRFPFRPEIPTIGEAGYPQLVTLFYLSFWAPAKTPATSSAQPPRPQGKQVSSASKPPTTLRSSGATPAFDVHDEASASDYKKWQRAREAQLKRK